MKNIKHVCVTLFALLASNLALSADNTVSVLLDVFSGRENPVIVVNLDDVDDLSRELRALLDDRDKGNLNSSQEQTVPKGLGYRGLVVFDPAGKVIATGESIKVRNDTLAVVGDNSTHVFENPYTGIEQKVIERAYASGKIDNHLLSRLNTKGKRSAESAPEAVFTIENNADVGMATTSTSAESAIAVYSSENVEVASVSWGEADVLLKTLAANSSLLAIDDVQLFNQTIADIARITNGLGPVEKQEFKRQIASLLTSSSSQPAGE